MKDPTTDRQTALESILIMNMIEEAKEESDSEDQIKVINSSAAKGGAHAPVPSMAMTKAEMKAEVQELIHKFDEYLQAQEARKERPRVPLTSSFYFHNEFQGRWKQQRKGKTGVPDLKGDSKPLQNNEGISDDTDMSTVKHAMSSLNASAGISNYFSYGALCHCLSYMMIGSSTLPKSGSILRMEQERQRLKQRKFFTAKDRKRALESILFSWSNVDSAKQQSSSTFKNETTPNVSASLSPKDMKRESSTPMPELSQLSWASGSSSSDNSSELHGTVVSSITSPTVLPCANSSATASASPAEHTEDSVNKCPLCKLNFSITRERPQFHCPQCQQRLHSDCVVQLLEHQSHQKCPCCHEQMISSETLFQMVEKVRSLEVDTGGIIETIELKENEKIEELYEDDEAPPGYEWEDQEIEIVVKTRNKKDKHHVTTEIPDSPQNTESEQGRIRTKAPEIAFV